MFSIAINHLQIFGESRLMQLIMKDDGVWIMIGLYDGMERFAIVISFSADVVKSIFEPQLKIRIWSLVSHAYHLVTRIQISFLAL